MSNEHRDNDNFMDNDNAMNNDNESGDAVRPSKDIHAALISIICFRISLKYHFQNVQILLYQIMSLIANCIHLTSLA